MLALLLLLLGDVGLLVHVLVSTGHSTGSGTGDVGLLVYVLVSTGHSTGSGTGDVGLLVQILYFICRCLKALCPCETQKPSVPVPFSPDST